MPVSDKHRLYGEVLCNFANAKNTDEAGKAFKESVNKALHYPSDKFKNYADAPFPTLEKFNREIENDKYLNNRQKVLIKNFIENHPSHLHYRMKTSSCSFRGLMGDFEINNLYDPYIGYSVTFSDGKLKDHNVGMPGPQIDKQEIEGEWVDMSSGDKTYIIPFDKKIDKAIKEYKLPEKEADRVINILHYYCDVLEPEHNHISRIQRELRNILDVLTGTNKFNDAAVSTLEKYEEIQTQTNFNVSYIIANAHGGISIEDLPPFREDSFLNRCDDCVHLNLQDYYDVVIIFFFFKFFREKKNHEYIKKCKLCGDFFIAKHKTRELCYPPKICATENKNKWQRNFMSKKRNKDGPDFDSDYI